MTKIHREWALWVVVPVNLKLNRGELPFGDFSSKPDSHLCEQKQSAMTIRRARPNPDAQYRKDGQSRYGTLPEQF